MPKIIITATGPTRPNTWWKTQPAIDIQHLPETHTTIGLLLQSAEKIGIPLHQITITPRNAGSTRTTKESAIDIEYTIQAPEKILATLIANTDFRDEYMDSMDLQDAIEEIH